MKRKLVATLSFILIICCAGAFSTAAVASKKHRSVEKTKHISAKPSIKLIASGVYKAIEALKCSPLETCSVWDQNYLKRDSDLKNILNLYMEGKHGQKSKQLSLAKKTKEQIIELLLNEGFTLKSPANDIDKILGSTKDIQLQEAGEIYVHSDGSVVRVKDSLATRRIRPQAYAVKAVLKNVDDQPDWQNEAFKVTDEGIAIPKGPKQLQGLKTHAPNSSGTAEDKGWIDLIMEEGHINILPSL